ncbi:uncharacterized protein LOC127254459 [Andrographis paniculata]|uniref:uncharacterized protein LOC127254459 n=1 Tax=Andrographis paniculata TaxID=175694 RepID=UPI0021E83F40|nr:uncharacterized protein LOC127254459 [Andrographis paniculata]
MGVEKRAYVSIMNDVRCGGCGQHLNMQKAIQQSLTRSKSQIPNPLFRNTPSHSQLSFHHHSSFTPDPMGCCISAGGHRPAVEPGSPPSMKEEEVEETVKEVLMETVPAVIANEDKGNGGVGIKEGNLAREAGSTPEIHLHSEIVSEVSEASEICSNAESYSNAAAAAEEEEDDGVVDQRPPAKKRRAPGGGRGRGQGRRALERRGQVAPLRSVPGRAPTPAMEPRSVTLFDSSRRVEGGEGSERRSRSPPPVRRGVEEQKSGSTREAGNDVVSMEEALAESLENPIVSLECFIFL